MEVGFIMEHRRIIIFTSIMVKFVQVDGDDFVDGIDGLTLIWVIQSWKFHFWRIKPDPFIYVFKTLNVFSIISPQFCR